VGAEAHPVAGPRPAQQEEAPMSTVGRRLAALVAVLSLVVVGCGGIGGGGGGDEPQAGQAGGEIWAR
jgi:hypothetical protein